MLHIIFYKKESGMHINLFQNFTKNLLFVCTIFAFVLIMFPAVTLSEHIENITEFESDMNYTVSNDSYENSILFVRNISELLMDNRTTDSATELESTITVTEDSDTTFQSESDKKLVLFLTPDEDICNCDLTSNSCDINCCCDLDCKEEDMQIFSECSHQVLTPDDNYCYQKDIILRNNTVYKMVRNSNNGLFCIVHDNFKHRLRFKDMPVLKSHRDLVAVLNYKYKTTYSWDKVSDTVFVPSELRAGTPVYVDILSDGKTTTSYWSLPSSCLSDMCSCQEDVKYLHDFRSSCSFALRNLEDQCEISGELAADHILNFCINLRSAAATYLSNSLADLVIHTQMVDNFNTSDDEVGQFSSKLCVSKNPKKPTKNQGSCQNVVRHVNFTVEQDGANGITGLRVDFDYVEIPFDKRVIKQSYSVNFVWSNISSDSTKKSGNPGYQIGLPILAATNGSDTEPEEISWMFYELGLSVLARDSSNGHFCSNTDRQIIKFGKNLKTGCNLKSSFSNCKDLQDTAAEILLGPSKKQIFVGVFGNANVSDPDDWIEVFHEQNDPVIVGDKVCLVSLGLKIDIVFAAVGTVANPQYKIVGVHYHYAKPDSINLMCSQGFCKDIKLSTSVSFFDVTLPAVEHYAKVPSIKANLPNDFFYPFLYDKAWKDRPDNLCLISILILYFLLL